MPVPSGRHPLNALLLLLLLALVACEFPFSRSGELTPTSPAVTLPTAEPTLLPTLTPTSPPILPTRPPTPAPQPTPTHDPGRAEWTVLVYLDADNSLDAAGLRDLNEMEAAGGEKRVNVVVQMDRALVSQGSPAEWTGARRFRVVGDQDLNEIASEPVEDMGEVNMGDPRVLADFLTWGITTYPANRYALILWDHGAGWNGVAFDDDVGFPQERDHITLADLDEALSTALAETGRFKLNLLAFDACLMSQLDVLQAVQPFAEVAVGSAELLPGQGWDYQVMLRNLFRDPAVDSYQLAQQVVEAFADTYTRKEPDDFVTLAAVDLARLPDLTYAVEVLAELLRADSGLAAGVVADARSGAQAFARAYADEFEQHAAVDLQHFASILAQRSPDENVAGAAEAIVDEMEAVVIANAAGAGVPHSGGISVYFPRTSELYRPEYGQVTKMPGWDGFLKSHHSAGLSQLPPPSIDLTQVVSQSVGALNPAYLEFEITGRHIEQVLMVAGQEGDDGRLRLLEYDRLLPEPTALPDGTQMSVWRDGLHEDFFIWDTRVTYLYDSAGNGEFVVMWPVQQGDPGEPGSSFFSVAGRLFPVGSDAPFDASLVVDHQTGQLTRIWDVNGGAAAEVFPQEGDRFQLYNLYRNPDGTIEREPGPTLVFDDQNLLYYDWRPLPDGESILGIIVENAAGAAAEALTRVEISNSENQAGRQAYLDPYLGFQFLIPDSWYRPVYDGEVLYTADQSGTTQLQVTAYPRLERDVDAALLQSQALKQFGPVDLLYPVETVAFGEAGALRTAYGYLDDDGRPHTGILFTLVKGEVGFVIDLDGPMDGESETIALADDLARSWQFRPLGFGLRPGKWARLDLSLFSVAKPTDFTYQEVNSWQRFSKDRATFVALRVQPKTRDVAEVLAALIRDAGNGVANFTAEAPFPMSLAGAIWLRSDFTYETGDGRAIWGYVMARVESDREVVAWAEAPSTTYNDLEMDIFLTMIADMTP